jgi:hypothetical protein
MTEQSGLCAGGSVYKLKSDMAELSIARVKTMGSSPLR